MWRVNALKQALRLPDVSEVANAARAVLGKKKIHIIQSKIKTKHIEKLQPVVLKYS